MEPTPDQLAAPPSPDEDLVELKRQVAKLETGVRLVAETLRRAHSDLSGTLSKLREEIVMTATSVDVRRILTEELRPLEAALRTLVGAVQGTEPDDETSEPTGG